MKRPTNPTLTVYYDEGCGPCTRLAHVLQALNWIGKLWLREAANYPDGNGDEYADIHSVRADGRVFKGYATYQQIAWRVPLLWLVAPFLYLPPVAWVGRRLYRRVADGRSCETSRE